MPDFWRSSGYHLLDRRATPSGPRLGLTDDFLRAYLRRPEIAPVAESCAAERALHAELMENPRRAVAEARLQELADPDAGDNYRTLLAFRDRLVAAGTIEDAYLRLFLDQATGMPHLFVDQLAHVLTRHVLDGAGDGIRVRAGELMFRPQSVTLEEGAILAADQETVEMYATTGGFGSLGRLVVEAQTRLRTIELDVLTEENQAGYFRRDERHDTVLDLTFARPGLDALCRVLEAFVAHMLGVGVSIQPVQRIDDARWVWHTGLDTESSRLLNDLYNGAEVDEERMARLLSLFRLEFADASMTRPDIAGRPVYLALAMTESKTLRLKPQNLLVNLPLAARA
ncbi:MAG: DUF6352 family protein [Alphaproteobacteria bacterium]|nr:DUF6352 family protein [Alphaproteobacteria bacterium]